MYVSESILHISLYDVAYVHILSSIYILVSILRVIGICILIKYLYHIQAGKFVLLDRTVNHDCGDEVNAPLRRRMRR